MILTFTLTNTGYKNMFSLYFLQQLVHKQMEYTNVLMINFLTPLQLTLEKLKKY